MRALTAGDCGSELDSQDERVNLIGMTKAAKSLTSSLFASKSVKDNSCSEPMDPADVLAIDKAYGNSNH